MKITDALITTLLKLGAVGEMKGFKTDIAVPGEDGKEIKVTITAESLKISMAKGD
jgi:hypothetical protein